MLLKYNVLVDIRLLNIEKMKRQTIFLILAVLAVMPCEAKRKTTNGIEVSVAQYRYDRECAVSLTFDDGIQEDYTLIAPHRDCCGLKGTFCINGAFIGNLDDHFAPRMTWDQCRELDARGHEIANHSWSHQNEYEISIEETRREIARNDSAIQQELGKRPLTYFFPFNAYTPEALAAAMYVAERDSVKLTIKKEKNGVHIMPSLSLDQRLYTMPLTLNVHSTEPITATQDEKPLPILRNGTKTFLEFNPFGGEIVIKQNN